MPERSTKAEARTPATPVRPGRYQVGPGRAQRRPGHAPRRHLPSVTADQIPSRTLNEGRGTHPGDTLSSVTRPLPARIAQRRPGHAPRRHVALPRGGRSLRPRSTKAGARTPATLGLEDACLLHEGRSTKAGARTPATRGRAGVADRDQVRSTKAGARTPATHPPCLTAGCPCAVAQRRPGHAPRRHRRAGARR